MGPGDWALTVVRMHRDAKTNVKIRLRRDMRSLQRLPCIPLLCDFSARKQNWSRELQIEYTPWFGEGQKRNGEGTKARRHGGTKGGRRSVARIGAVGEGARR